MIVSKEKYPKSFLGDKHLIVANRKELINKYSPKNCMKYSGKVRTVENAINSKSVTVGTLQRARGRDFTEGLIMGWLAYLNDILNLNKPMTDDQIEMCAIEVVNDYYNLKFSDLTLLFKRIISGQYGEFYESLSIPKVLTFFRDYNEERLNISFEKNLKKHNDRKGGDPFEISKNIKRIWRGTPSK